MTPAAAMPVRRRQLPQGATPPAPAPGLVNDPADPLGLSVTTTSSYNYWWPYPPGGVPAPATTTTSTMAEPTDDPLLAGASITSTESLSSTDSSDTLSSTLSASDDLIHVTAVVPMTETTTTSTSPTASIVSAYKTPHKFNILWLTPLFVLVGVLIGATIAGWTYGRWARRRGRVSSITAHARPSDDDGGARGTYAQIVTGARIPSGTRRVSARRQDSFEDVKLIADEKYDVSPHSPSRPQSISDDEDDFNPQDNRVMPGGLLIDFSPAKAIKGWIASVRSMGSVTSAGIAEASPPRRTLQHLHVREATVGGSDAQSNYSMRRYATVYRASPSPRAGVTLADIGVTAQQRLTPVSTIDNYTFGSTTPDLTASPQRSVNSLPPASPSRYTPVAMRPSSRHTRIRSAATSDATDDDDRLRIRQSILEKMNLLKDEVSIESSYPVESSEDEWPSPSPSRGRGARNHAMSPDRVALESIQGSPVVREDYNNLRLSAEMAREKRHSSAVTGRARSSVSPGAIPVSNTANSLLARIKARLENSKVQDAMQALSPTPSEALIGSAFRNAVSPQPSPASSPLRQLRAQGSKREDPTRMHTSLDASVLSLELDAPPPPSRLSPNLTKYSPPTSPTPPPPVRKGEIKAKTHRVRTTSSNISQETASIKLTISRSSSSSISSGKTGRPRAPTVVRPSASPNSLTSTPPNRIPRLSPAPTPTRPLSAVTPRKRVVSTHDAATPPPLPRKGDTPDRTARATSPENALAALKRTPARRISATVDGVGGRTISVSAAAVQARRERGASITPGRARSASKPPPPPSSAEKPTKPLTARAPARIPSGTSARRGTDASALPKPTSSRTTRSNTAPTPQAGSSGSNVPRPSRKEALSQVDAILARSWSERDIVADEGWKSPTNFGADAPTKLRVAATK